MAGDTLDRFVTAQAEVYDQALAELRNGLKRTHWMWFVFPQLRGLGHSARAQRDAIADLGEARRYLAHPLLGPRLSEVRDAVLAWAGRRSAEQVLGGIDALKFRSSMTLFEAAGDEDCGRALDAFFAGGRDPLTRDRLSDDPRG